MNNVLDFLNHASVIERQIASAEARVTLCLSMTQRITATLNGNRVSQTRNVHANEDAIIKLSEARETLEELQKEYSKAVGMITGVIGKMHSPLKQDIMLDLYLRHVPVKDIADKKQMSRSQIYRLHRSGLIEIAKILG